MPQQNHILVQDDDDFQKSKRLDSIEVIIEESETAAVLIDTN